MKLAMRVNGIGISPILKALETERYLRTRGHDIISLTAGEPDFATPEHVVAAARVAMESGDTRYPPLTGTGPLKGAILEKLMADNGLQYKLPEIIVSTGSKQAIYNAFMATLDPGDEVILPVPYWTSYPDIIRLASGVCVFVETLPQDAYQLDPDRLEAAITPRTRWLLLNSPSNPSGAVYTVETLVAIAEALRRHPHVMVLCDDIYEHIIFDGPFRTLVQVAPDLRERCLIVNGVSKAYAMTGWRLGYAAGPASLVMAMSVIQAQSTTGACTISQAAAVSALTGPQEDRRMACQAYAQRREIMVAWVDSTPGFAISRPRGAFYAFVDCREALTQRGYAANDDTAFADWALREAGVSIIPGSAFGAPGFVRLSFATSEREIIRGLTRLSEML